MFGLHRLDQVVCCACLLEIENLQLHVIDTTGELPSMVKDGGALSET